jgi:hypothetical protein
LWIAGPTQQVVAPVVCHTTSSTNWRSSGARGTSTWVSRGTEPGLAAGGGAELGSTRLRNVRPLSSPASWRSARKLAHERSSSGAPSWRAQSSAPARVYGTRARHEGGPIFGEQGGSIFANDEESPGALNRSSVC